MSGATPPRLARLFDLIVGERSAPVEIKSAGFLGGHRGAGGLPGRGPDDLAGPRTVAGLWRECDLTDASGGITFTFVVFPVSVLANMLLVPISALLFAGCRRIAVNLVSKGQWNPGNALGLMIPVGVVVALVAAALASVLVVNVAKAQIPPDYPTTCSELGNGYA
jgi:hypothetical protein